MHPHWNPPFTYPLERLQENRRSLLRGVQTATTPVEGDLAIPVKAANEHIFDPATELLGTYSTNTLAHLQSGIYA